MEGKLLLLPPPTSSSALPQPFKLWDHQEEVKREVVLRLAQHRRVCVWAPTGFGKTELAISLALDEKSRGGHTLFIVERKNLCHQAYFRFLRSGLSCGMAQAENTKISGYEDVTIASIQTLGSRSGKSYIQKLLERTTLIVVDEAHILYKHHVKLIEKVSNAKVVGLTATPLREGMKEIYQTLIRSQSYSWLIEHGYLVPPRYYVPDQAELKRELAKIELKFSGDYAEKPLSELMQTKQIVGDIIKTWKRFGEDRQTIVFCVDIDHSRIVARQFEEEGIKAGHIDCYTEDAERSVMFRDFKEGKIKVLCSVGVLSIGFDEPRVGCIVMARPTLSTILYIQQIGRGLRPFPGKKDCIVIDHALNVTTHGAIEEFYPVDLIELTKKSDIKSRKDKKKKLIECRHCSVVYIEKVPSNGMCTNCGQDLFPPIHKVNFIENVSFKEVSPWVARVPLEKKEPAKKLVAVGIAAEQTPVPVVAEPNSKVPEAAKLKPAEPKLLSLEERTSEDRKWAIKTKYLMYLYIARERGYKDQWAYYRTIESMNLSGEESLLVKFWWRKLDPIAPDPETRRSFENWLLRTRKYYKQRKAAFPPSKQSKGRVGQIVDRIRSRPPRY